MKQIAIAMLILMSVLTPRPASANKGTGDELNRAIKRQITYPEFGKAEKLKGMVMVKFELDSLGQITVREMNASHEELGAYVSEKLTALKLNAEAKTGTHYIRFTFKYEGF